MTDAAAPSTAELETVLAGPLALLRDKPDTSLDDLAAAVAVAPAVPHAEAAPFPKLPKHIMLTAEVLDAISKLQDVFNSVEIKDRRSLAQTEIDLLTKEAATIGTVGTALAARLEVIKETMRVHMDVAAEEAGIAVPKDVLGPGGEVIVAATDRDQKGHYLLAKAQQPYQVPSAGVAWSQEFKNGSVGQSDALLTEAADAGEISREDYLAATREVRVFDAFKARELIRKSPAAGLALLRRITVTGRPSSSLTIRKNT